MVLWVRVNGLILWKGEGYQGLEGSSELHIVLWILVGEEYWPNGPHGWHRWHGQRVSDLMVQVGEGYWPDGPRGWCMVLWIRVTDPLFPVGEGYWLDTDTHGWYIVLWARVTDLMVPVGDGQGLINVVVPSAMTLWCCCCCCCCSGMFIFSGGMGLAMRLGGLGRRGGCARFSFESTRFWNTILMLVLGNRNIHLQIKRVRH